MRLQTKQFYRDKIKENEEIIKDFEEENKHYRYLLKEIRKNGVKNEE